MLACAGDEIYADESSILGSIGVISASFGFTGLMEKIGVQRRVYTAGANKDVLDPFLPEKPADVKRIKAIQLDVHQAFIDLVKERRGAKLVKDDKDLFTGEFWSGKGALELGLIDGLSDLRSKMREVFGEDVRFRLVAPSTSWFRRKRGVFTGSAGFDFGLFPDGLTADVISAVEARALWSRFGL
jgi:ClpP class serine protease